MLRMIDPQDSLESSPIGMEMNIGHVVPIKILMLQYAYT
jgi:hypothetical protein